MSLEVVDFWRHEGQAADTVDSLDSFGTASIG
jgi:hypothetical protein